MKTKKITALLCALAIAVSASVSASAAANTDWPQFLGTDHCGVTTAQTPAAAAETELAWSALSSYNGAWGPASGWGTPISVGDYLYVTDKAANRLKKVNAKTGAIVAQTAVNDLPSTFAYIACGDGKIYVPQETAGGVKISAFSADTLAPVWQSNEIAFPSGTAQMGSPIAYSDHHIYFGTYVSSNYVYVAGSYVSISTADGTVAWKTDNASSGYYWAGAAVLGSAVAALDNAGTIHTFALSDGHEVGSIAAGTSAASTLAYSGGALYASLKDGYIFAVNAASDGTLASSGNKSAVLGSGLSSSPVVYNGRLYVAGGGFGATAPFSVLNASDLSVVYQISGIHSQSTPLVSTAYATEANHQQVLIYVADYGAWDDSYLPVAGSSRVYAVKDSAGQTTPSYETLFAPAAAQSQSSTQTLVPSGNGMLYYYNDGGTLFALGKKAVKPAEPASGASSAASAKPSSSSASAAGTVSSSSTSSAPNSPKTGEAPAASTAVLLACSGAVLLFLKKKVKR